MNCPKCGKKGFHKTDGWKHCKKCGNTWYHGRRPVYFNYTPPMFHC